MTDNDIKAHMENAIATLQTIQNNYPIDDPDIDITLNQTLDFLRWERFKVINKIRRGQADGNKHINYLRNLFA